MHANKLVSSHLCLCKLHTALSLLSSLKACRMIGLTSSWLYVNVSCLFLSHVDVVLYL